MFGMAKDKATITVDRAKLSEARALLGVSSASAAIDVALSELVRRHRLLNDVNAYIKTPPTDEEAAQRRPSRLERSRRRHRLGC